MSWKDDVWGVNRNAGTDAEYTIVVDFGDPYEIKVNNKTELKKELKKTQRIWEENDYSYGNISVYDKHKKDITNKCIKDGEVSIRI